MKRIPANLTLEIPNIELIKAIKHELNDQLKVY